MPNYEYRCRKCHSLTIINRKIEERDDEVTCICGQASSRIYNTPAVQFKGTGFYSTDN